MTELRDDLRSLGTNLDLSIHRYVPLGAAAHVDIVASQWNANLFAAGGREHAVESRDGQLAFHADEGQLARYGLSRCSIGHLESEQAACVPVGRDLQPLFFWRLRRLLENASTRRLGGVGQRPRAGDGDGKRERGQNQEKASWNSGMHGPMIAHAAQLASSWLALHNRAGDVADLLVGQPLLLVAHCDHPVIDVVELGGGELVAEVGAAVGDSVTAAVLADHELAGRNTDGSRIHDFVGRALLEEAILVDAGFVREGVLAYDGLVGLHADADDLGQKLAGRVQLFGLDTGGKGQDIAAHLERHDDLKVKGRISPRTLSAMTISSSEQL